MKKIIIIISLIVLLFAGCDKNNQPKIVNHNFTKQQWIGGLISTVSTLKLHLNNYTATKNEFEQSDTYAYENSNSSLITLGTVSTPFDIPVTRQDPYSIYLNDVNSTRLQGDAHDGLAFITINFESDGTEIIGDCVNNIACICGAPKLDLSNIVAIIPLAFAVGNGTVSIEAQDATFTSDISESGPCVNNACAFFCDILAPNKNSDMQKAIAKFFEDYVNQNSALIAIPFNQYLQKLGVSGAIVSFEIKANGDLSIDDKE